MVSAQRLNIIVLGYIIRGPLGGLAWHHLQYVLGLALMGHKVTFMEDSDNYESCYDPVAGITGTDPSYGLAFAQKSFETLGIGNSWAYYDAHNGIWHGPRSEDAVSLCSEADVLLNLSAVNPLREWFLRIDVRALIDTDPVFTQIKHLQDANAAEQAMLHTHHLSFGENISQLDCSIPDDGITWCATRQPVVPLCWQTSIHRSEDFRFTTIMQWDSYPAREYDGISYGMKSASFAAFMDLPEHCSHHLEIALGSDTAPRQSLESSGWKLRDSLEVTKTISSYRDYLNQSSAEFGISKQGYVSARTGWFSERSINYLACGKPVVVQDTGFDSWMDVDCGVVKFSNSEEAVAAMDDVHSNYKEHCEAAREVTQRYFHYEVVLNNLLNTIHASSVETAIPLTTAKVARL